MAKFSIKAAVSALLIFLLLRNRDVGALASQLSAVDPRSLIATTTCYWAVAIPSAIRWPIVVDALGYQFGFRCTFPIVLIGYFFNLTLVSSIGGDGVRMWEAHRTGLPGAVAITSVIIERLLQFFAHLCLIAVEFAMLFYSDIATEDVRVLAGLSLASVIAGICAMLTVDRLPTAWQQKQPVAALCRFSSDLCGVYCAQAICFPRCYSVLPISSEYCAWFSSWPRASPCQSGFSTASWSSRSRCWLQMHPHDDHFEHSLDLPIGLSRRPRDGRVGSPTGGSHGKLQSHDENSQPPSAPPAAVLDVRVADST